MSKPYAMRIDPREEGNCSLTSRTINTTGHRRFLTGGRRFHFLHDPSYEKCCYVWYLENPMINGICQSWHKNHNNQKSYFLLPNWAMANCPLAHKMEMNTWLAHTSQICYGACIKYNYFHEWKSVFSLCWHVAEVTPQYECTVVSYC